jgi:hypothetical protein
VERTPHYLDLAESFALALEPVLELCTLCCHISWRQVDSNKMRGKKCKKGHTTLCGSTVCVLVLCVQRLRRNVRQLSGGNPP